MEPKYKRWQEEKLLSSLKTRRVIILAGPRQVGKTTVVKKLTSDDIILKSLDDIVLIKSASEDPYSFVKHTPANVKTIIIDEIQRVPELLIAIKKAVDENDRYGQYLITGSANIQNLPTVKESLAGRVRKIRLRALTQGEILGNKPIFLEKAFNQQFDIKPNKYDKDALLEIAFRGGFPEATKLSPKERTSWFKDYIDVIIDNDLKDLTNIKRYDVIKKLIKVMSAWSSKYMDKSSILSSLTITKPTFDSYINVLNNMYLIENVNSWIMTDYEYVKKKDKFFITDSGLMSSILEWKFDAIREDPERVGKIIETFVFNELSAQIDTALENYYSYALYQYRDREKREIDFIIERSDGALLGIEVKSGSVISSSNFKHLKWFKEKMGKNNNFIGIILYTGEHIVSFGKNLWGIPVNILWE